ncbi:hypothetical protein [Chamaesiphon minutus]|nr:hypothetical protein [Chamaesiphon minutus]
MSIPSQSIAQTLTKNRVCSLLQDDRSVSPYRNPLMSSDRQMLRASTTSH